MDEIQSGVNDLLWRHRHSPISRQLVVWVRVGHWQLEMHQVRRDHQAIILFDFILGFIATLEAERACTSAQICWSQLGFYDSSGVVNAQDDEHRSEYRVAWWFVLAGDNRSGTFDATLSESLGEITSYWHDYSTPASCFTARREVYRCHVLVKTEYLGHQAVSEFHFNDIVSTSLRLPWSGLVRFSSASRSPTRRRPRRAVDCDRQDPETHHAPPDASYTRKIAHSADSVGFFGPGIRVWTMVRTT